MAAMHPETENAAAERPEQATTGEKARQKIQFYLVDCQSPLGKAIDIVIVLLNLLVCVLYVASTYPQSPGDMDLILQLEAGAVFLFIIEYAARLYAAENRLKHLFSLYSLIDLAAILPMLSETLLPLTGLALDISFINTLRVLRVLRIFRFLRFTADEVFFFGSTTKAALKIIRLGMTLLFIFFVSSGLFYQVESPVNGQVQNFGDAFYFTVVTLTTVGFGDITPVSSAGRWVTVLMILSGIILIPWQASQVVVEWLRLSSKSDIICPNCGLMDHDRDASHCKACGHIIYQEYDGH